MSIISYIKRLFKKKIDVPMSVMPKQANHIVTPINYDEIYSAITDRVNCFLRLLSDLPPVTYDGRVECEIICASTLTNKYKKVHIVNAIYINNKDVNMNFYAIERKFDYYKMLLGECLFGIGNKESWGFTKLARMKGSWQIRGLIKPDIYGNTKHAIFTDEDGKSYKCGFFMLTAEQQNLEYIQENKESLSFDYISGDMCVIFPSCYENYNEDMFFDILTYWIYCNPLGYEKLFRLNNLYDVLLIHKLPLNKSGGVMKRAFREAQKQEKDHISSTNFDF